ncbi:hypothetical protein CPB83DRAFT_768400, partial [Crepidotus variabilis]
LDEEDLPHRFKLGELNTTAFKKQYAAMSAGIQVRGQMCQAVVFIGILNKKSLGRVSFTTDTWTGANIES